MMTKKSQVVVIGGGFGGMATAALLAKDGFSVKLFEKNDRLGGRAEYHEENGFVFDYGPSWYLMPEVFERFFAELGYKVEDLYTLYRVDPYYRVYFGQKDFVDISQDFEKTKQVFESFEKGGAKAIEKYVSEATYKYEVAMKDFLYKEYRSIFQFFNWKVMREGLKLGMFQSLDNYVQKFFKSTKARQILEYAMVFLGNSPHNAPALYSILSHVDLKSGVFFPRGGIASLVKAFERVLSELGVEVHTNSPVSSIEVKDKIATGVWVNGNFIACDHLISNADYAFTETQLLPLKSQTYKASYWSKKVLAPTMFIIYLGLNKKLTSVKHHTMYFSEKWDDHFDEVFSLGGWPKDPCYYVSTASYDDEGLAPQGHENVFFLVPLAPGMEYDESTQEAYADKVMAHFEHSTGEEIRPHIVHKKLRAHKDFSTDYNSYMGSSLGLSHTLMQTAIFRPAMRSKKVKNLRYVGQYTHPGVGVPMTIIASEVVRTIIKDDANDL